MSVEELRKDVVDDLIDNPTKAVQNDNKGVSPCSSHSSLSKQILNNYNSQSLHSLSTSLTNLYSSETKSKSLIKSSENISSSSASIVNNKNCSQSNNNLNNSTSFINNNNNIHNISINLVSSEEETDDDGIDDDDDDDEEEENNDENTVRSRSNSENKSESSNSSNSSSKQNKSSLSSSSSSSLSSKNRNELILIEQIETKNEQLIEFDSERKESNKDRGETMKEVEKNHVEVEGREVEEEEEVIEILEETEQVEDEFEKNCKTNAICELVKENQITLTSQSSELKSRQNLSRQSHMDSSDDEDSSNSYNSCSSSQREDKKRSNTNYDATRKPQSVSQTNSNYTTTLSTIITNTTACVNTISTATNTRRSNDSPNGCHGNTIGTYCYDSILEEKRKYTPVANSDYENLKDQLNMLKYELKEKDLDIVQLQKEINELQLENKMLKTRIPLLDEQIMLALDEAEKKNFDLDNPYLKELITFKREKECVVEELIKAQDTISRLKLEKSTKSIDLYDPNNPEILHKKLKTYEKQVHDLEEENERCVNDLSKLEKALDKYKIENTELKSKVNETRIYKEQEEALLLEIANMKNELKKYKYSNHQLGEENQRLIIELNNRPEPICPPEGISVGTQTPVQNQMAPLPNQKYTDEENEMLIRKYYPHQSQQQQFSTLQRANPQHSYHQSHIVPHHKSNGHENPLSSTSGVSSCNENEMNDSYYPDSYNNQSGLKKYKSNTLTKSATIQVVDPHNPHSYRNTNSNSSYQVSTYPSPYSTALSVANQSNMHETNSCSSGNSGNGGNGQNNYNLSRVDDYLINNFRPFSNATNTISGSHHNNHHSNHHSHHGQNGSSYQQPSSNTTNSSRMYHPSTSSVANNYLNGLTGSLSYSQRSNQNHTNTPGYPNHHHSHHLTHSQSYRHTNTLDNSPSSSSSSYLIQQNGKSSNNHKLDDSCQFDRHMQVAKQPFNNYNGYSSNGASGSYCRSISTANVTDNSHGQGYSNNNTSMNYDDQDSYLSRRDINASITSLNKHNSRSRYSSAETIMVDDSESSKSSDNEKKSSKKVDESSKLRNKSLKINVMRDLKSAQKLKSAMTSSKYSHLISNEQILSNTSKNYSTPTSNTSSLHHSSSMRTKNGSSNYDGSHSSKHSQHLDSYSVKRSQTFNSSTLPRNMSKRTTNNSTTTNANYLDSDLNVSTSNFLNNQLSPSNSQTNIYNNNNTTNDSRKYNSNYEDDDSESEFSRSIFRSKSADRGLDKKSILSSLNRDDQDKSFSKDILSRKRPFVPLRAEDIRPGDYIKFSRPGGKISKGMVKYIGPLPDRNDIYFGLELDSEEGKHDGTYLEKRYFQTKPNKGVFVSFSKVVMAWG